MALQNNTKLGQHWLKDRAALAAIAESAELTPQDTVLEIGPGLGTLTSHLLRNAGKVVAVEFDPELARKLPGQFPGKNLQVVHADILHFDEHQLPHGYKVVANVPYYITSKIVQKFLTSDHPPQLMSILVQKEVAQRIAANPGDMSMLAVAAQVYAEANIGLMVPRDLFTPPPKVDSQVVTLHLRQSPLVSAADQADFFRLVRLGFAGKRKKLRSSLSAGLRTDKPMVDELCQHAGIESSWRAEDCSIDDWLRLLRSARHRGLV